MTYCCPCDVKSATGRHMGPQNGCRCHKLRHNSLVRRLPNKSAMQSRRRITSTAQDSWCLSTMLAPVVDMLRRTVVVFFQQKLALYALGKHSKSTSRSSRKSMSRFSSDRESLDPLFPRFATKKPLEATHRPLHLKAFLGGRWHTA